MFEFFYIPTLLLSGMWLYVRLTGKVMTEDEYKRIEKEKN